MKTLIAFAIMSIFLLGCVGGAPPQSQPPNTPTPVPQHPVAQNPAPTTAPSASDGTQNTGTLQPPPSNVPTNFSANITREIRGDILTTDTVFPVPTRYDFSNKTTPDGRTIVYYFYEPRCSACLAIKPEIDMLKTEFPAIAWMEYDLTSANGSLAYKDFASEWNLSQKQKYVPQVLVNGTIITDRFNINDTLGSLLANLTLAG